MPKNKDANDAWVKGAQFIDLVNLGTKEDPAAAKKSNQGEALYINIGANKPAAGGAAPMGGMMPPGAPATGAGGFQPMAFLNE